MSFTILKGYFIEKINHTHKKKGTDKCVLSKCIAYVLGNSIWQDR